MKRKNSTSNLVTKSYFKNELKKEFKTFELKIDVKLEDIKDEINENARKYRDQILSEFDKFVKELRDAHEERVIVAHQLEEVNKRLNNHAKRITILE